MSTVGISPNQATIIIAAYNEAAMIEKTLELLTDSVYSDGYQILVVCNGCDDDTEIIIREKFRAVHCRSRDQASKALAIRYAESLNPGFPRLYLDADIQLKARDASALLNYARSLDDAALVIPSSNPIIQPCSTLVKIFYRVWYSTSHVRDSGFGAGAYLLNRRGRNRFDHWPELIADDGFVRSQFSQNEIHVMQSHAVTVKAPANLMSLLKVKIRSKLGNIELNDYLDCIDSINKQTPKRTKETVLNLKTFDHFVYFSINAAALVLAKWQHITGKKTWYRDNSNR